MDTPLRSESTACCETAQVTPESFDTRIYPAFPAAITLPPAVELIALKLTSVLAPTASEIDNEVGNENDELAYVIYTVDFILEVPIIMAFPWGVIVTARSAALKTFTSLQLFPPSDDFKYVVESDNAI